MVDRLYSEPDLAELYDALLRFLDAGTLAAYLSGAGMPVAEQFGDCDRQPVTATSPEIITVAVREA